MTSTVAAPAGSAAGIASDRALVAPALPPRDLPREAWILAGTLDGAAALGLLDELGGIPHVLRLALDAALAGARQIYVIWSGEAPPPDLTEVARDPRLAARAALAVVTQPPGGATGDGILITRADRVGHRDLARDVANAYRDQPLRAAKITGDAY
ncbi:MAG: hypothetical protein M3680_08360, partial [Myxococcota bacterium]|nr:hypothetical protein [Myxococcota bacterium]